MSKKLPTPTGINILVKPDKEDVKKSSGGLFIVGHEKGSVNIGTVVKLGKAYDGYEVKVGDRIMYPNLLNLHTVTFDDELYVVLRQDQALVNLKQ